MATEVKAQEAEVKTQEEVTEKGKPTKEQIEAWVAEGEQKFDEEIKRLAKNGAFQKIEESKAKLEAPVFVMPGGKGYNLQEKALPLLAKLAENDLIKGKTSHLFVSWYSVNKITEDFPNIQGVKKGSTYVPIVLQQSIKNKETNERETVPVRMSIIPMAQVNGDTLDKMKFFLKGFVKTKDGEEKIIQNPIPHEDYATKIAKLVDYSKITPAAIEKSGARAVITEAWKEAQEKYRAICNENEKYFNERLENIKNAPIADKDSPKLQKLMYTYKKNYLKAVEAMKQKIEKNKEKGIEMQEVPFPAQATYNTAKDLLLMGESIKNVQGYINKYDPNSAHNIPGLHYLSNSVIRGIANDYKFKQEYKEKFGKTFAEALSESYQPKTQGASR